MSKSVREIQPLTYIEVAFLYPNAWDGLPECYRNDSCLEFFIDVNENLCAEFPEIDTEYSWTGSEWVEII